MADEAKLRALNNLNIATQNVVKALGDLYGPKLATPQPAREPFLNELPPFEDEDNGNRK